MMNAARKGAQPRAALLLLIVLLPAPADGWSQTKVRLCWTSFASNMSGSWVAYPDILEATYGEARSYIENPPYVSRKGLEAIIAELTAAESKAKQPRPDDFVDHRFVVQLEREGFFKGAPR